MLNSFNGRLKAWRTQHAFSHAEAASYVSGLKTGDRILPEKLEKLEAGMIPSTADRLLLEFFMSVNPPKALLSAPN